MPRMSRIGKHSGTALVVRWKLKPPIRVLETGASTMNSAGDDHEDQDDQDFPLIANAAEGGKACAVLVSWRRR